VRGFLELHAHPRQLLLQVSEEPIERHLLLGDLSLQTFQLRNAFLKLPLHVERGFLETLRFLLPEFSRFPGFRRFHRIDGFLRGGGNH
jgi:hypothetical protein